MPGLQLIARVELTRPQVLGEEGVPGTSEVSGGVPVLGLCLLLTCLAPGTVAFWFGWNLRVWCGILCGIHLVLLLEYPMSYAAASTSQQDRLRSEMFARLFALFCTVQV